MFDTLKRLPADPILGLSQAYASDTNPTKVDLGVGVYKNAAGHTPIMAAVLEAEKLRIARETTKAYTPPAGVPGANEAVVKLVYGESHPALLANRVRTIQTPGGCGSLRVAAELIQRAKPGAGMWVSTPTWANHIPLLGSAGMQLHEYPIARGDIILLHACCHNPSGADLSREQWQQLAEVLAVRGIIPFIDMAYQGFGEGLEEDAYGLRLLAERLPEVIVAVSFSKNFGLYRERAGSLSLVLANPEQADAVNSQLLNVTRGLYSMPPAHGSSLVDIILHSQELTALWQSELTSMRERIASLRVDLVAALNGVQSAQDFSFIARERGMFSFLGLTAEQVQKLRSEYSIYMTDNSRISVSGLSSKNIAYVAEAIEKVI